MVAPTGVGHLAEEASASHSHVQNLSRAQIWTHHLLHWHYNWSGRSAAARCSAEPTLATTRLAIMAARCSLTINCMMNLVNASPETQQSLQADNEQYL